MSLRNELIRKIDTIKSTHHMSDREISLAVSKDHRVIKNLRDGKNIYLDTIDSLRDYLMQYPDKTD